MIVTFGSQVQNDNISWYIFHFFNNSFFSDCQRVKLQTMTQNDKKILLVHLISDLHL